ncbi:MAG: hypothetical protein OXH92_01085 [Bryobacterales bacterium]|nr:hypothetical protein [Bryobacterales bacterium]
MATKVESILNQSKEKQVTIRVDRVHHMCLTISTEHPDHVYPDLLAFYTSFVGLRSYRIPTEQLDREKSIQGLEDLGAGKQEVKVDAESGEEVHMGTYYYLCGEDASKDAALIDFVTFHLEPGQNVEALQSMNGAGLRNVTFLVDNLDELYARGQSEGVEFLSAPAEFEWGGLGRVKYAVMRDPLKNPIEFIQLGEASAGQCKVLRVFSLNHNTQDIEKALDFYRDGCGMNVEHVVEHSGREFGIAMGFDGAVTATSYLLKGANKGEETAYFTITDWEDPKTAPQKIPEGYTPAWYRMWFWIEGSDNVRQLYDDLGPRMKQVSGEPFTFASPEPWGPVTIGFFFDHDDAMMEFACHDGHWDGMHEVLEG